MFGVHPLSREWSSQAEPGPAGTAAMGMSGLFKSSLQLHSNTNIPFFVICSYPIPFTTVSCTLLIMGQQCWRRQSHPKSFLQFIGAPHPSSVHPTRHSPSRTHEMHFNVAKTTVLTKSPFFCSCQNQGFVVIWSSGLSRFLHHACLSSFAVSYNISPAPAVCGSNRI